MTDTDKHQIILDPVTEEKQPAVALFLSGCFSLPPASTRRIAAAGPIAILSDLELGQAKSILADLTSSMPEGLTLRVAQEEDASDAGRLEWPRQPKIFGKPVEEFRQPDMWLEATCPACGKPLAVHKEPNDELTVKLLKKNSTTAIMRSNPESEESDKDPLFSGIKPLVTNSAAFAAMRSLQAGDTGFWGDARTIYSMDDETPPEPGNETPETSTSAASKSSSGLAAYLTPGVFAVVIARTKDASVVKNVAEIMGISENTAREKCLSLSLCVARGISLDEARTLLARFKTLGAKARIAKPM